MALVFREPTHAELGLLSSIRCVLIRRSTTDEWLAFDPILLDREPAVDTTKKLLKIGDGIHHWSELPHATAEEALTLLVNAIPKGT